MDVAHAGNAGAIAGRPRGLRAARAPQNRNAHGCAGAAKHKEVRERPPGDFANPLFGSIFPPNFMTKKSGLEPGGARGLIFLS
jgi:hypothetical protein